MRVCSRALTAVTAAGLAIVLLTMTVRADGEAQFALQPARHDPAVPASRSYVVVEAQPGNTLRGEARIANIGTAGGSARLYPVDATTEQRGGAAYRAEYEPREDVGAWIVLDVAELTLD